MRRTIEVIVETEELLIVNGRSSAASLKCPACGAAIEPVTLEADAAIPYGNAREICRSDSSLCQDKEGNAGQDNPQVAAFRRIRRLHE
jgi:hypothetical protein